MVAFNHIVRKETIIAGRDAQNMSCTNVSEVNMRLHSGAGLVFARPSTAEYRETAPPTSRLGTGADTGPSAFYCYRSICGATACWPHPCRARPRCARP